METLEEAASFETVLHNLCTPSPGDGKGNGNNNQKAAVCSALVEVIKEKLPSVTSAALFASTINALNGTITSSSASDSPKSLPQISLLTILEEVVPFASSSSPGLYLNQFHFLSLTLRGIIASIPSPKSSNTDNQHNKNVGWNALLRSCIRASTVALNGIFVLIGDDSKQAEDKKMEKEVIKMFHETIIEHFEDPRAKVRKQAHSCALDLLKLCFHQLHTNKDRSKRRVNTLISGHLMKYCNHVVSPFLGDLEKERKTNNLDSGVENESDKREKLVRLLHLLAFVESAITVFPMDDSLALGQTLISLIVLSVKLGCGLDQQNSIMVVNAAMSAVLQVIDSSAREDYAMVQNMNNTKEEDEFCAKAWASLLQTNLDMIACTSNESVAHTQGAGDCRTLYARCIVAIASRLMSGNSALDNIASGNSVSKALVPKLLPLSFTSIINCLGENEIMNISAQGVCAELGRLVRSSFKDYLLESGTDQKCITDSVSAMQKLLHYRFRPNWNISLPCLAAFVVSLMHGLLPPSGTDEGTITKMKECVKPLVLGLVQVHVDMKDKESKSAIEQATSIIIDGIGIELFLSIVDISSKQGKTKSMLEEQWILNVLKESVGSKSCPYRPRLAFFQSYILGLARKCDASSAKANMTAVEVSIERLRVIDFWSLFPSFCKSPTDIEVIFPTLAQTLVRAMSDERYPQLVFIICTGLKNLTEVVLNSRQEEILESEEESNNTDERVLSEASVKLLPALFKLVEKVSGSVPQNTVKDDEDVNEGENEMSRKDLSEQSQRIMAMTGAIAALATLSPEQYLRSLFKKVLQRLLVATQSSDEETEKICTLLQLSQSIVKSAALNEECITLLYRTVRPLISNDTLNHRVQKRAYKVMADMCENYRSVFIGSPDRFNDMTEFMISSVMSLHVSARHMRLKCMKYLVEGFEAEDKTHMDIIPKMMGEVLLCLKDTNGKTRESAYQLLVSMAKVRSDFTSFFQIIIGALGAQTSHMRSAAVMALSRIAFEFSRVDFTVQSLLPSLLKTVIVLFDEQSREVTKSVIGFVRISVAALNKDDLEPLLPELVSGLMKFNRSRGRFRSKIKIIIKILVRNYGYEVISELVPESDSRLINHMKKLSERAARKKAETKQNNNYDGFEDMMESDEEDSDGGRTLMTGATGFTKMTGTTRKSIKSITKSDKSMASTKYSTKSTSTSGPRINTKGEDNGEILDMLDSSAAKNIQYTNDDESEFSDDDDAQMEFDDDGKLVIHDDMNDDDVKTKLDNEEAERGQKRLRISRYEMAKASRQETHMKKNDKKKKESSALGAAYKNKKGGGDARNKDQEFDPYAYVPLDARSYTKKNRSKSVSQMSTLFNQKSGNKRKRR